MFALFLSSVESSLLKPNTSRIRAATACLLLRLNDPRLVRLDSLLVRFAAASSPDGHRLAVLVEASPAAVDVGVSGRRHWLLPGPDGFGCRRDEDKIKFSCLNKTRCVCASSLLTDLGRMSPPGHVLGSDGLLDAVHLLLVALAVAGGVLLGLLQSRFQGLDPLSRSTKTLFQFRKLTAQVCIVTNQLQDSSHRLKPSLGIMKIF